MYFKQTFYLFTNYLFSSIIIKKKKMKQTSELWAGLPFISADI